MKAEQYKQVKAEVAHYIGKGAPSAAETILQRWALLLTNRQYYELADTIYAAMKAQGLD